MSDDGREKEKHLIIAIDMPHYPLLPVIHRERQESGIIIAGDNRKLPLKVYMGNIFSLKSDGIITVESIRTRYKCIEFISLDAFLDAGWKVD